MTDTVINWIECCHKGGEAGKREISYYSPAAIMLSLQMYVKLAKFCLISVSWKTRFFIADFLMQKILRPHLGSLTGKEED